MTTDPLEELFRAARATPQPGADFLARMVALAEAEQPRAAPEPAPPLPTRSGGFWAGLVSLLGLPALGGMATAAVAGLWIGAAGFGASVPGLAGETLGTVDLVPTAAFDMLTEALGGETNG